MTVPQPVEEFLKRAVPIQCSTHQEATDLTLYCNEDGRLLLDRVKLAEGFGPGCFTSNVVQQLCALSDNSCITACLCVNAPFSAKYADVVILSNGTMINCHIDGATDEFTFGEFKLYYVPNSYRKLLASQRK